MEERKIPLILNLIRESMGDPDAAIMSYHSSMYDTNYANPLFCLCPNEDFDFMDIAGAIEGSLHAMLDHGCTDDDVRAVMGLQRRENVVDDEGEMPGDGYSDDWFPVDLGWYLPSDLDPGEVISPEECASTLHRELTETQVQQVVVALEDDRLDVHDALTLTEHEFTDWQAHAICKAFREHVAPDAARAIADPRFNHAQMRALAGVSLADTSSVFRSCLNPDFSAGKIRLMGVASNLFVDRVGGDPADDWHAVPYDALDEGQLVAVVHALHSNVPLDVLSRYADGTYPAPSMEAVTLAFAMGYERSSVERLLNPAYDPEQAQYLSHVIGYADGLGARAVDLLCDPDMAESTMEATFYGLFHLRLDVETVRTYADGSLTPQQMRVVFDATRNLALAGMDPEGVEDVVSLIADPDLSPEMMQDLMVRIEGHASRDEVSDLKEKMLPQRPTTTGDRSLTTTAKESRVASTGLSENLRNERSASPQERE